MPRKPQGLRALTDAERSARKRQRQAERVERLEQALQDLLLTAERGTIGPRYVAARCREALTPQ